MKTYEALNHGEWVVGTFPKISINPKLHVMDSHNRLSAEELLPMADSVLNIRLGLRAAELLLCRVFEPEVLSHIEVVKIGYFVNINHTPSRPIMRLAIILREPISEKKIEAKAHVVIDLDTGAVIEVCHELAIATLVERLRAEIGEQLKIWRPNSLGAVPELRSFYSLFSEHAKTATKVLEEAGPARAAP